uniref:Uncharacterized protein n=1 Tax=Rangifer tarandus platyrhynchus TaxID=3082113 RepID=A0ACB0DZP1_RANTA|nr:unnamed protein product [Rangifer tarandus platyrhynchus]
MEGEGKLTLCQGSRELRADTESPASPRKIPFHSRTHSSPPPGPEKTSPYLCGDLSLCSKWRVPPGVPGARLQPLPGEQPPPHSLAHVPGWGTCCVRAGGRGASRSQAGIFLAATRHRPVLGGQLPERRCSGRSGPAVICQERQASAFAHQAPAGCSQAEASGLFLEPGPSPDARIPAEISSGSN